MKKYLSICILLCLLVVTSCAGQPVKGVESSVSKEGKIENIKVTASKADVRSGCSTEANVLNTANKNNEFQVINQVEDWYAVKLDNNQIGFVPKEQCSPIVKEGKNAPAPAPSNNAPAENTPATNAPGTNAPGTNAPGTNAPATPNTGKNQVPADQPPAGGPENQQEKAPATDTPKDTDQAALSKDEQALVNLVNQARAENNLSPLKVDLETSDVARIKSQDMIDNNYFSHNSPTYGSPFDMLQSFGIKYIKAGENIAGNQTVEAAHQALMNSPGHRKNILSPDYTHIGVGIKNGGPYQKMFTQMFLSKPQ